MPGIEPKVSLPLVLQPPILTPLDRVFSLSETIGRRDPGNLLERLRAYVGGPSAPLKYPEERL
jgi:hypothetical protein